jgi:hypothetical protein
LTTFKKEIKVKLYNTRSFDKTEKKKIEESISSHVADVDHQLQQKAKMRFSTKRFHSGFILWSDHLLAQMSTTLNLIAT